MTPACLALSAALRMTSSQQMNLQGNRSGQRFEACNATRCSALSSETCALVTSDLRSAFLQGYIPPNAYHTVGHGGGPCAYGPLVETVCARWFSRFLTENFQFSTNSHCAVSRPCHVRLAANSFPITVHCAADSVAPYAFWATVDPFESRGTGLLV